MPMNSYLPSILATGEPPFAARMVVTKRMARSALKNAIVSLFNASESEAEKVTPDPAENPVELPE